MCFGQLFLLIYQILDGLFGIDRNGSRNFLLDRADCDLDDGVVGDLLDSWVGEETSIWESRKTRSVSPVKFSAPEEGPRLDPELRRLVDVESEEDIERLQFQH